MPRNKHIRITITSDGAVSVDAANFRGEGCKAATLEITAALGQVSVQREKPEARLRETNRGSEKEGAR